MIKTRFAPSPTGYLHLGNARTALFNALFAKQGGGIFVLRIDDTDTARSKEEYKTGIIEDLSWLGISWDETFSQSSRVDKYETAMEELKLKGLLYACYESEEDLALARRMALQANRPPVYNRAALNLTQAEHDEFAAKGINPHWRFKLSQKEVVFEDLLHGQSKIKTDSLSDPVLVRADGRFLYTLPSVLDDLDHNITHIIRGDDHLTNSAVQVELALALGGTPPIFAHHPLMVNEDGSPLSKRNEDFSLRYFKQEGFEPQALVEFLTGTDFNFQKQASQNIRYQRARLEKINARFIHALAWDDVKAHLPENVSDKEWQSLRNNLTFVKDAEFWHDIIYGDPALPSQQDEAEFLQKALSLLPPSPLNENSWGQWTKNLAQETGRKGKALYLPLRLALTGQGHGPEMKHLIELLGHEKITKRLSI